MAHPFGDRSLVEQTDSKEPKALESFSGRDHVRWSPAGAGCVNAHVHLCGGIGVTRFTTVMVIPSENPPSFRWGKVFGKRG